MCRVLGRHLNIKICNQLRFISHVYFTCYPGNIIKSSTLAIFRGYKKYGKILNKNNSDNLYIYIKKIL